MNSDAAQSLEGYTPTSLWESAGSVDQLCHSANRPIVYLVRIICVWQSPMWNVFMVWYLT